MLLESQTKEEVGRRKGPGGGMGGMGAWMGSEPRMAGRLCVVVTRAGEARVPRWMEKRTEERERAGACGRSCEVCM